MIFAIGIDFKVIKCYGKNRKFARELLKNRSKALKQFKKDYAVTLEYLEQCGYGEFNTDFETLQRYETYSWQHTVEKGTENEELIKSQLGNVSSFLDVYYNGSYTYYFPFCKAVS